MARKAKNPPVPGAIRIYPESHGVTIAGMNKEKGSPYDVRGQAAGYKHRFKRLEIWGLPNGDVLLTSRGKK